MKDDFELIEPDPTDSTDHRIDEQLSHGLLRFSKEDDPRQQSRRIARLMRSIDGGSGSTWRSVPWPLVSSVAALIVVAISLFSYMVRSDGGSEDFGAVVQSTVSAPRRYSVRASSLHALHVHFEGEIDLGHGPRLLLKGREQGDASICAGRDDRGHWVRDNDDTILRSTIDAPKWLAVSEGLIFLESPVDILARLDDEFDVEERGLATRSRKFVAKRVSENRWQFERVEFWVDSETDVLERMELHWPHSAGRHSAALHGHRTGPHPAHFIDSHMMAAVTQLSPPDHMVFELVSGAVWPEDWFTPKAHSK